MCSPGRASEQSHVGLAALAARSARPSRLRLDPLSELASTTTLPSSTTAPSQPIRSSIMSSPASAPRADAAAASSGTASTSTADVGA